ncbi:MAG: hypothetical protein KKB77_03025 [Bacteroidetes bacterium]|nr:hypothetical protein [Bacteroidota bacterium]MBU2460541.1 hypothetical protein [Patescibacteria group bacterium]
MKKLNLVISIKEAKVRRIVPIIAEIKRLIPKLVADKAMKKDLRDAGELANLYQKGGAIGISLVAEKEHFGGQPEIDIPRILTSVDLPLLIKDFITNEARVDYYAGLVSVIGEEMLPRVSLLLISHHLGDKLSRLIDYIHQKGMLAQVEIRGVEDLSFLKDLKPIPQLIGLNNKVIDQLEQGIDRVVLDKTLVDTCREVVGDCLLISSSAHHSPAEVRVSIEAGADAVLAGTAFMQAEDPRRKVHSFVFAKKKE